MIRLVSTPKIYSADQDKATSPESTLARVRERLASLPLSILAETRRIDTGRLGIPVFLSICGSDARTIMPTRKQMGKGASAAQAEASALMELMERYGFFTFWDRKPGAVHATWSEAEARFGDALISLREIIAACHDSLEEKDARNLLDLRQWLFFPVTRIADEQTVYLPLDLFKQLGEFNGSSAGNTDVESILQGACELVERHVCALIDRTRPTLPTINPESIHDPVLAELVRTFHDQGIELILKDASLGMPVPTVIALAKDPATFPHNSEIVYTAGTASSPAKAAIRAVTEVAQLAGDFCTSACYEASGLPKYTDWDDTLWLRQGPLVPLDHLPDASDNDMLTELKDCAAALHAQGFSLYSIATTNPDTEVPSHYTMVPGFHFRERDVNASLGLFIGRIICEQADEAEASAALDLLERIYPNGHFLPFFRGMLALRAENLDEARRFFAEAEPLQPGKDAKALAAFYLGYTYTLEERWAQAREPLERAARLCPEMKEYRNLLGVCLFKKGRYEEAAAEFTAILILLDKGSVMDMLNLGVCHFHLGNRQKAVHYLQAALEIDPGLEAAAAYLAKALALK